MELNFYNKKQPICPHCNAEYSIEDNESWELYTSDDNHEIECPDCEKTFWVQSIATFTFSTAIENDDL